MKFKGYLGASLIMLALSGSCYADEESHSKAVDALLDSMNINTLLAQSIESMMQFELQQNPAMAPYADAMREFFELYMGADSLRPEFVRLYMETFTEKEITEITAFYSTPTGQKALMAAPDLMAKGAAIGQQKVMENISELQRMIVQESKRITELQKQN